MHAIIWPRSRLSRVVAGFLALAAPSAYADVTVDVPTSAIAEAWVRLLVKDQASDTSAPQVEVDLREPSIDFGPFGVLPVDPVLGVSYAQEVALPGGATGTGEWQIRPDGRFGLFLSFAGEGSPASASVGLSWNDTFTVVGPPLTEQLFGKLRISLSGILDLAPRKEEPPLGSYAFPGIVDLRTFGTLSNVNTSPFFEESFGLFGGVLTYDAPSPVTGTRKLTDEQVEFLFPFGVGEAIALDLRYEGRVEFPGEDLTVGIAGYDGLYTASIDAGRTLAIELTLPPGYDYVTASGIRYGPVNVVPVPAAVWLLGSALAGLGVVARRRQKRAGYRR